MKTFILGITMLVSGIVGFAGWIIGCAINNGEMTGLKLFETLGGSDLLIAGVFVLMMLVGLFISFFESKKE